VPHRKTIAIIATGLASLAARGTSLFSQAIVGVYLSEEQLGAYALALGILGVTGIWRAGGVSMYLPSLSLTSFNLLANPMFTWAWCFGLATLLLTAAFAHATEQFPHSLAGYWLPGLDTILVVMAFRSAIFPIAMIGRLRLAVEHRFVPLAKVDAANALIRLVLTWWIASTGGGAMALAIPFTAHVVIEAIAVWLLGGFRGADLVPRPTRLRAIAPLLAWPLTLGLFMSIRTDISFLIIGTVLPAAALGLFYFAFQLANQPTLLLAGALQNVLAPMVAKARGDQVLERISMERVFASSMLFVPITTLAAAAVFPSVQRLVWAGKWEDATPSVVLLSVGATYSTVASLMLGPLIGLQRFKEGTFFEVLRMSGVIAGCLAGGLGTLLISQGTATSVMDVTLISAAVTTGMVLSAVAQIMWIVRRYQFDLLWSIRNLFFGPAVAGLTALASFSIGQSAESTLGLPNDRLGAAAHLVLVSAIYSVLIALAIRFTAESVLEDALLLLPEKSRKLLRRFLVLRCPGSEGTNQ